MRQCLIGALVAAVAMAAPQEDLAGTMPGTTPFDSTTYSGYLTISDTKKYHYVFAESLDNPATDPVVVWFNGGPGCSSMLGFMQENGPRVIDDGESYLKENPEAWIKRANVMWLEQPAGVGWSTGSEADMTTNDMLSSQDALVAMQAWYDKFPEFLSNDLYLSGESYAGIYVPYLAW
jgi:carboxypeptidase C (cathepsin A)